MFRAVLRSAADVHIAERVKNPNEDNSAIEVYLQVGQ